MTGSQRFFSTSTVRITTNIIAKLNFWISFAHLVNSIRTMHPVSSVMKCTRQSTFGQTTWFLNDTSIDKDQLQDEHVFSLLAMLFIVVLLIYVNFYLAYFSYAITEHEVYRVHQWLVVHTIIFVFSLIFLMVSAFVLPDFGRFLIGLVITLYEAFGLYVVRIFYHDEIECVQAIQNRAAVSAVLSYANQTTSAPPLSCVVQAGQPDIIQPAQQPGQQQAQAYPFIGGPLPQQLAEPHIPQVLPPYDLSKPPPYSP